MLRVGTKLGTAAQHYVRPASEVPDEYKIYFAEAVARVTDAFSELRDRVLPVYISRTDSAHQQYEAWRRRWHVQNIEWFDTWTWNNVLRSWSKNPEEARNLDVTLGWWEGREKHRNVPPPLWLKIACWDRHYESFDAYKQKVHSVLEDLLEEERRFQEKESEACGERIFASRQRDGLSHEVKFEWLALRICGKRDGQRMNVAAIARQYSVSTDRVRKSTERLAADLDITDLLADQ